jgi:hypothetical protein
VTVRTGRDARLRAADDRSRRRCLRQGFSSSPVARAGGRRPVPAGFIRFTPSLDLTNLGVDTNVFNELDDPKDDFTVTFGPKAEFWSRLGLAGASYGRRGVDYQYFQEYDSQRSFGHRRSCVSSVDLGASRRLPKAPTQHAHPARVRDRHEGPPGRCVRPRGRESPGAVQDETARVVARRAVPVCVWRGVSRHGT